MAFNSLRAQLLGWLLVPLALYAVSSAWFTYGNAMETATVIQDRLLPWSCFSRVLPIASITASRRETGRC